MQALSALLNSDDPQMKKKAQDRLAAIAFREIHDSDEGSENDESDDDDSTRRKNKKKRP